MDNIIITNNKDSITFDRFPTGYEIDAVKDTYPSLEKVIFKKCIIEDFSLMEVFSDYALYFEECEILNYGYPITINSNCLYFYNTLIDFEKLFFMTNMPNLSSIFMLYDSVEGVMLYKPYIHLLKFFPTIESIKLMMATDVIYYDMKHTKVFKSNSIEDSNVNVMLEAKLWENLKFLELMPNYFPGTFDGIFQVFSDMDFNIWRANKRFWVNPKFMDYYNTIRRYELFQIKKELINLNKFGPLFKDRLGRDKIWYNKDENPMYSFYKLDNLFSNTFRIARLNSNVKKENESPDISILVGLFGEILYNTHGHIILVNSRGNIICDYSKDEKTKKLVSVLLPF